MIIVIPEESSAMEQIVVALIKANQKREAIQKISTLQYGKPYEVMELQRKTTQYGDAIVATVKSKITYTIDPTKVYLPKRFNEALSDKDIEEYNEHPTFFLTLVYRGLVNGRHEIEISSSSSASMFL